MIGLIARETLLDRAWRAKHFFWYVGGRRRRGRAGQCRQGGDGGLIKGKTREISLTGNVAQKTRPASEPSADERPMKEEGRCCEDDERRVVGGHRVSLSRYSGYVI